MALITHPNAGYPDAIYDALISAHHGLDDAQSTALNARLILLLINQIGDTATVIAAIDAAASFPKSVK
jgi:hypothetical protein